MNLKKRICAWAIDAPWAVVDGTPLPMKCTPKWAEHTFASFGSKTKIWSCSMGGKDETDKPGVRRLVSAPGSLSMAKCLGTNNSGIVFSVNGVCHQCTNRVLCAASKKITVAGAKGWAISYTMYGVYGIDSPVWEYKKFSCGLWLREKSMSVGNPSALPDLPIEEPVKEEVEDEVEEDGFELTSSPSSTEESSSEKYLDYHNQLSLASGQAFRTSEDRQANDLAIFFRSMLDGRIPALCVSELQNIQSEFHRKWTRCHSAWLSGEFTSDKLLDYRMRLSEALFSAFEKNLGETHYTSLYGISPSNISGGLQDVIPSEL